MRRLSLFLLFAIIFVLSTPLTRAEEEGDSKLQIKETVVCDFVSENQYYVSNNLESCAYVKEDGGSQVLVFNGKEGKKYKEIKSVLIAPDGKSVAYIATSKGKSFVVHKGRAGKAYDEIIPKSLIFTGDSKHLLYVVSKDGQYIVVDKKKEGEPATGISELTVSRQGGSFAYQATDNPKHPFAGWLVEGTKANKGFAEPSFLQYSPKGKKLFFLSMDQTGGGAYVGGKKICCPGGASTEDFIFSEDGKNWMYSANFQLHLVSATGTRETPPKRIVYVNFKEKGTFSHTSSLVFAKEASTFAFVAEKNDELAAYVNGKKYKELHGDLRGMKIVLSPNGKRTVIKTPKTLYLDKKSVEGYQVGNPYQFNCLNQFCQIMTVQGKVIVDVDGKQVAAVDAEEGSELGFSPKGVNFAFMTESEGTKTIVIGEENTGEYEHILFGQQIPEKRDLTECDGRGGMPSGAPDLPFDRGDVKTLDQSDSRTKIGGYFGKEFYQPAFIFDSDNKVHFYAVKGDKVVRVDVTIK